MSLGSEKGVFNVISIKNTAFPENVAESGAAKLNPVSFSISKKEDKNSSLHVNYLFPFHVI